MKRLLLICILLPITALAADPATVILIHNHQFEPQQLDIPAGVKLKLIIRNQDDLPAEFESYDLSREVVVPGQGEATLYVGPLEPGRYQFFNDFNHEMQGSIVVKTAPQKDN